MRARWVSRWAGPRKDPRGVEVGALGVWGRSVVKGTLWCPAQTVTPLCQALRPHLLGPSGGPRGLELPHPVCKAPGTWGFTNHLPTPWPMP